MKGISPLIAIVLLIGFTVAVGGILSVWLTSLTTTTTNIVGTAGEKQIKCSGSVLDIIEVVSNLTSSRDSINTTIRYIYGEENLYYFNLTFIDDIKNSVTVTPVIIKNFNKTNPLSPGMVAVFALDIGSTSDVITTASLSGSSIERVSVLGRCQDTVPITDDCKVGQSCMK